MEDLGILVVDDNRTVIGIIERMFGHYNVRIDYVLNAASALELLQARHYRTMITDLDMPGMNGLELTRRAREQFPHLNVVLFTGNVSSQVMQQALEARVSEVYFKPIGFGDMMMSILNKELEATDPDLENIQHWC